MKTEGILVCHYFVVASVHRVGKRGKLVVYSDFEGAPMVENEERSEGTDSLLHWSPGWGIFIGGLGENFTVSIRLKSFSQSQVFTVLASACDEKFQLLM